MNLVRELRAQLELVVRDPTEPWCGPVISDRAFEFANVAAAKARCEKGEMNQAKRVRVLTAAIRAAVVTREAP